MERMKQRELSQIKNGEKVLSVIDAPSSFHDVQRKTFLDRNATQKALADLHKYGYICKNEKSLWVTKGDAACV